jgi:hypothetical protein
MVPNEYQFGLSLSPNIEEWGANSVLGANYTVTTPFFKPLLIF